MLVVDSCSQVKIEDCYIVSGDDCVAIKSGWDEYGISVGMPSQQITIRRLTCISPTSAVIALGSEMSGGIQDVRAEDITAINSESGVPSQQYIFISFFFLEFILITVNNLVKNYICVRRKLSSFNHLNNFIIRFLVRFIIYGTMFNVIDCTILQSLRFNKQKSDIIYTMSPASSIKLVIQAQQHQFF
jgi:Glycosyl hydrolases family 28